MKKTLTTVFLICFVILASVDGQTTSQILIAGFGAILALLLAIAVQKLPEVAE